MTKLGRREFPAGLTPADFTYKGRPAKDQGDFGLDVGIADMACVNQFGEANNSKFFHGGVVQSKDGRWWLYTEWGRCKPGNSWSGSSFTGCAQDFMFLGCSSESEARSEFRKKMESKNTKRLMQKNIGGATVWAALPGEDGYIVQKLATRDKGLPDAYAIKDGNGVTPKATSAATATPAAAPKAKKSAAPTKTFQPQVIDLASALVGGVRTYTRALSKASGVSPTKDAIEEVRTILIPAAMQRLKVVGSDVDFQVRDADLRDITKMVAALVPRPIPRTGQSEADFVLNSNTIFVLQQDLDAFESALGNEDFNVQTVGTPQAGVDPDSLLNASLTWLDPNSPQGRWVWQSFVAMTNNRHSYTGSKPPRLRNVFAIERPDRDARFHAEVKRIAALRKGHFGLRANLQPKRSDVDAATGDLFAQANVAFVIHGTRPVNIAPITQGNFRLPRQLPGAQITGANFGHGIYFASDFRKSYGYTGRGYWGHGGGDVAGRGCFMFLCDMLMGDAYRAPRTGSWSSPPDGKDSVFGVGGDRGHALENDEHVIFSPDYQKIRYLIEIDWLT